MTEQDFAKVCAVLAAAYPHRDVPDATIALYREHLIGARYEDVMEMVHGHVRVSGFWPAISELIPPRRAQSRPVRESLPAPEPPPTTVNWPRRIIEQLKALEVGQRKTLNRDGSWEDQ